MIPETARFYRPIIKVGRNGLKPVELCTGFALNESECIVIGGTGPLRQNDELVGVVWRTFPAALQDVRNVVGKAHAVHAIIDCGDVKDRGRQGRVENVRRFLQEKGLVEEEPIRQER
jgi:hypothetical protein